MYVFKYKIIAVMLAALLLISIAVSCGAQADDAQFDGRTENGGVLPTAGTFDDTVNGRISTTGCMRIKSLKSTIQLTTADLCFPKQQRLMNCL